jgi:hypothetical protein
LLEVMPQRATLVVGLDQALARQEAAK